MARGGGEGRANNGVRKKTRANNMGLQWWRKLTLPRRGKKDSVLSPAQLTESQQLRLRERTLTLQKSLVAPRVTRTKHLAEADWDTSTGTAIMCKARGNMLQSMGYFTNGKQRLFPEEALFLVDKGSLELRLDGLPMSVQRAWTICTHAQDSLTLEGFLAYGHLRRAGYVVRRYVGPDVEVDDSADCDGLRPSLSVWRVGAFKRRDSQSKPAFHVAAFAFEDAMPALRTVAKWSLACDRTRVRLAVIDRGVVVLTDMASNATPLSDRFVRRQNGRTQACAVALRNGDASFLFDSETLAAFDAQQTTQGCAAEHEQR